MHIVSFFVAFDFPRIGFCFALVPKGSAGGRWGRRRMSRRPGVPNHWVDRTSNHMGVKCHVANSAFCDLRSSLAVTAHWGTSPITEL